MKPPGKSVYEKIYAAVRRIPRGKVASYGQIASVAGCASARQVGYALAVLPYGTDVPWHRVINARGRISFPEGSEAWLIQRGLLEAEGIRLRPLGSIDLQEYRWKKGR